MAPYTIERNGRPPEVACGRVTAVCTSTSPGEIHSGVWLIDARSWGIRATTYGADHPCRPKNVPRGCTAAAQLRAVKTLLDVLPTGVGLDVHVTDNRALDALQRWLSGDTTPLAWYASSRGTWDLSEQLSATSAGLVTVALANHGIVHLTKAARGLAEAGEKPPSLPSASSMRAPATRLVPAQNIRSKIYSCLF